MRLEVLQVGLEPKYGAGDGAGDGIGLADGFLTRVSQHLAALSPRLKPELVAARCGAEAGLIGVADLARGTNQGKCII